MRFTQRMESVKYYTIKINNLLNRFSIQEQIYGIYALDFEFLPTTEQKNKKNKKQNIHKTKRMEVSKLYEIQLNYIKLVPFLLHLINKNTKYKSKIHG